jgi:hypothetical protein
LALVALVLVTPPLNGKDNYRTVGCLDSTYTVVIDREHTCEEQTFDNVGVHELKNTK